MITEFKHIRTKTALFIALSIPALNIQASTQDKMEQNTLIFPAENIASSESNTGEVHLSILKDGGNTMITNFCFSPGSRNFWHYHPNAEQTLLVLDGEGYYQEEGEAKRVIKKGDVIVSKANVRHWNGATPDMALVCMTVTEHAVDGHVVQLRPVTDAEYGFPTRTEKEPAVCAKQPMSADGIIRLSKVEVDPAYLDEYMRYATDVGEISLRTEPGVLTMYALQEKDNPCNITILETYASQEAYRKHIASAHFQKYKQGTLHMVKNLQLLDQTELNPSNKVVNYIKTQNNMAQRIIQTAGRQQLGDFAPEFAHLNDDILFGEVWSRNDLLSLRDRSLVTITSLISQGITDNSLTYHLQEGKKNGITRTEAAEIITHIAFYAGWPKAWAAFNLAKQVWKDDNVESSNK